ncbi:hypothetical protein G4Y79_19555 [Phototrophicus methaneseepsis]|uniref:Transmembrane protein n=1 Tax=Phototrophicus methaneseepsis TaxID=2710758 RepID=A0A7S8E7S2_9CHLR|nr:hypothetical protein [Phototrophicus methaneseepsis]QPC81863.1 hypothetical protein G4Y79_19555 [Phototrophicus methaneseepsis]
MNAIAAALGGLGWIAVAMTFLLVARLSRRLGNVTHARPYYLWMNIAALLITAGAVGNFLLEASIVAQNGQLVDNTLRLLCEASVAVGVSLGLGVAWYYWSWLLAERD